jgi:hypothetical protein
MGMLTVMYYPTPSEFQALLQKSRPEEIAKHQIFDGLPFVFRADPAIY